MTDITDLVQEFRGAERRLRALLFGDGVEMPGRLKGEEVRDQVARDLRRMRDAFTAVAKSGEGRTEQAEARVADLEEELKKIASSRARRARGTIEPPKKRRSGSTSGGSTKKTRSTRRPASRKAKRPDKTD